MTVYLLECSIYILKYVVAAVVGCGVWEEVDTSCTYGYRRSDVTADIAIVAGQHSAGL